VPERSVRRPALLGSIPLVELGSDRALGGGERFTVAPVADEPYLVDLDASTGGLTWAITARSLGPTDQ